MLKAIFIHPGILIFAVPGFVNLMFSFNIACVYTYFLATFFKEEISAHKDGVTPPKYKGMDLSKHNIPHASRNLRKG